MPQRFHVRVPFVVCILVLCATGIATAQQPAAAKKPITHDVYDSWKTIQGTKLSRDGVWAAYALTPQDGDGELEGATTAGPDRGVAVAEVLGNSRSPEPGGDGTSAASEQEAEE